MASNEYTSPPAPRPNWLLTQPAAWKSNKKDWKSGFSGWLGCHLCELFEILPVEGEPKDHGVGVFCPLGYRVEPKVVGSPLARDFVGPAAQCVAHGRRPIRGL